MNISYTTFVPKSKKIKLVLIYTDIYVSLIIYLPKSDWYMSIFLVHMHILEVPCNPCVTE